MKNLYKLLVTQSRLLLSALCAIALATVIGFSLASCSDGGGGSKPTSTPAGDGVKFPVIFKEGKFCDGVSVTTGDYETGTGKKEGLQKGKVTVTDTSIVITPAGGKYDEWYDNDDSIGHYELEFILRNNLNLRGYDGLRVELAEEWDGWGMEIALEDATGKTTVSWGTVNTLHFGVTDDGGTFKMLTGYFEGAWGGGQGWALELSDFTHVIKNMHFGSGIGEDSEHLLNQDLVIKSVEFIKK
jgi:hypothetical protein